MKLFLGLPVYGGYNAHFVHSLLALVTARPRPCEMVIRPCVGDSLVARARNRLCAQFLASDCTHLLFLDTDLIFSVEQIRRLLDHGERVPIVCGLYPKKQRELGWVCNLLDGDAGETGASGLRAVKYAGTGCMLVAREVFERMKAALPEIEYDPDDGDEPGLKWDFFGTGVRQFEGRRRYLSEDWMFCQRAWDLHTPVLVDTQVVLKHVGECVYPLQELAAFADAV